MMPKRSGLVGEDPEKREMVKSVNRRRGWLPQPKLLTGEEAGQIRRSEEPG